MKTVAYYIWILERKICKNKRCGTCSKLNENHHCKTWNQKVVRPDNMCILWEKTKQEELKMCNEETKNICKEALIAKINNVKNEEDKEKLINDYGEKYGDFIQKYIEIETTFESLKNEVRNYYITTAIYSMSACIAIFSLFVSLSTTEHMIPYVLCTLFIISIFFGIIGFGNFTMAISIIRSSNKIKKIGLLDSDKIKKDMIIEVEYNKTNEI